TVAVPSTGLCFTATYNDDATYNGNITSDIEPLSPNKLNPTVVTAIKDANGNTITSADIGSIVHDTVHVSGSQGVPTGTVTFHRYANQTCTGTATDERSEERRVGKEGRSRRVGEP